MSESGDRLWSLSCASRVKLCDPLTRDESRSITFTTKDFDDGEEPDCQQKGKPVTCRRARDDIGAVREHERDRAAFFDRTRDALRDMT